MVKKYIINGIKDFNLAHIFECGQCFRWNKEDDVYVGVVGNYVASVELNKSELVIETTGGDENFWRNYFDLDTDYSKLKSDIVSADPKLKEPVENGYGIRILNQDLFETMISFIISQNNNIPRIKKCIESLSEKYGENLGEVFGKERFAFPTVEALANAKNSDLGELKLGYRSEYIVSSARKFDAEGLPSNYEEVLAYPGVGPKVANCIMLFGLHRIEAFPIDTWIKKIMSKVYGFDENDIDGMSKFAADKYGKYAGIAQQYIFYYYRNKL